MAIVATESNPVGTRPAAWTELVKSAIRDPRQLCERLGLPADFAESYTAADHQFSTFVPDPWLRRIRPGDPRDPLLLQVLPSPDEMRVVPGFTQDAVGDVAAGRGPGLIQKYEGRVLLITRGVCAIHCRYCFRRHYPYHATPVSLQQLDQSLDTVREDNSIEEVILSGGDPLMMVDEQLLPLIQMIADIRHVRSLRIHTRLPVVIPQRVTPRLTSALRDTPLTTLVVLHINHDREIDEQVIEAAGKLAAARALLLNQTVLLRGINDRLETLVDLSRRLLQMKCLPYYLHQLDRVAGTAHFEVPQETGERLVRQMRERLPGYAVPRYVQEIAGQPSKSLIV